MLNNLSPEEKYHNQLWYYKTYNSLIEKCLSEVYSNDIYTEVHHILPKCMGGTDDESNLVRLPAREHIIAHMLLMNAYPNIPGLSYATHLMISVKPETSSKYISSRTISIIRENYSRSRVGTHHSEETRRKISEGNKGKEISREHVEKLRSINKGKKHSKETRLKMSISKRRENLSEETRRKRSEAGKNRKQSEEIRKKISKALTGRTFSKTHKENLSKSKIGKPGHKHSEETKKKISKNKLRKKVLGPDNVIYDSIKECSERFKICRDTLRDWIKNKPEKGFKFIK